MSSQWSSWTRNVIDKYKDLTTDQIREALRKESNPIAVCMEHWKGDFNISTLIRNANAFNVEKVYYLGKRKVDRRGTVGTHHYTDVVYLADPIRQLLELKDSYTFVAIDNNIPDTQKLHNFSWNKLEKPPLIFFGEEGEGLTEKVLNLCDYRIEIQQYGSVRSLNVGTASGIILHHCVNSLKNSTGLYSAPTKQCGESGNAPSESLQLHLL